jgi:hypothetical protein
VIGAIGRTALAFIEATGTVGATEAHGTFHAPTVLKLCVCVCPFTVVLVELPLVGVLSDHLTSDHLATCPTPRLKLWFPAPVLIPRISSASGIAGVPFVPA